MTPIIVSAEDWRGAYLKTFASAIALVALILFAQGFVDANDRAADARAEFLRAADDKCLPLRDGQSAVIISAGNKMQCRLYSNSGYGLAPRLVSAAVVEVPPL